MCWAILVGINSLPVSNADIFSPYAKQVVTAGKSAPMITADRSGAMKVTTTRFGMMIVSAGGKRNLVWNARDDRLNDAATWSTLIRQRCVVPIDAYTEKNGHEEWMAGAGGFAVGFYDTHASNGGMALITESNGTPEGRRPIVVSAVDAARWLKDEQWDAIENLTAAPRLPYHMLDLFEGTRLSVEARNTVVRIAA